MRNIQNIRKTLNHIVTLCASIIFLFLLIVPSHAKGGNVILQGVVTSVVTKSEERYFVIRTPQGMRYQIFIDDHTHVLRDNVEFSVANIDNASISQSSIRVGNRLEIIGEVSNVQCFASIVTVISSDFRWKQIMAKK